MFWNQVEKGKKKSRKRESWIKKKRERFWNLVEKEKEVEKKGEDGNKSGHTCMVEKKQEKKKVKKKKKEEEMYGRKKGKII